MQRRQMGRTRVRVAQVGQGTWQMDLNDRKRCIATLRYGIELGMRHIDTAELYGHGWVERRIVRDAIAPVRDEVYVVSKVRPPHTRFRAVLRACERSLRRLKTDRLDLFLLHWRDRTPLDETLEAFERLKEQGKVRAYGVSNFVLRDLQEATRIAGPGRIACNQVAYSVIHRAPEEDILPWCVANGVSVVAYSPLGAGAFPPKGTPPRSVLELIGDRHGATAQQVALAFLLRHPAVFVIPKHSSRGHARANAEAAELELDAEEIAAIESAFPISRVRRSSARRSRFFNAKSALRRLYGFTPRRTPAMAV